MIVNPGLPFKSGVSLYGIKSLSLRNTWLRGIERNLVTL
jgi:hypothetical protein